MDQERFDPTPGKDFVIVKIGFELEYRKIDRIEMEPGYIMSGRANPHYVKRLVPVTYEGELVEWTTGSDIPRIIKAKC